MRNRLHHSQRGFSLIEAAIVIAIGMMAMIYGINFWTQDTAIKLGQAMGKTIAEYNSAVAAFINANLPGMQNNVLPSPVGIYWGTAWLKSSVDCPGVGTYPGPLGSSFLPCGFPDSPGGGLQFNTVISNNSVGSPFYLAVSDLGRICKAGQGAGCLYDGAVAGAALLGARSWIGVQRLQAEHEVGFTSYRIDPATGDFIAQIDTATNADAWLRRDGSNAMAADLNMGGHNIVNVMHIRAQGDIATSGDM